jgi:transcriptional regulator with XRE-family HTH domain
VGRRSDPAVTRRKRHPPCSRRLRPQVELAEKIGIIQGLVSDYERGRLRPHPDMLSRFASALQVSTDELLGLEPAEKTTASPVDRRFLRRFRAIKGLPKRDQEALLRTIDAFLTARQAS